MDPIDIDSKRAKEAQEDLDEAMERLDEAQEASEARRSRSVRLDERHYFDPLERSVLMEDRGQLCRLGHTPVRLEAGKDKVDLQTLGPGFRAVSESLFWNPATKHLYVKHGETFVLYARNPAQLGPLAI